MIGRLDGKAQQGALGCEGINFFEGRPVINGFFDFRRIKRRKQDEPRASDDDVECRGIFRMCDIGNARSKARLVAPSAASPYHRMQ
jgi:hypothetical protein